MFYISFSWQQYSLKIFLLSSLTTCFHFCVTSSAVLAYLTGNVLCKQAWKKCWEGGGKTVTSYNWCHHWRQHACKLQPQLWSISWSVDGVEKQRYVAYFGFFFLLPRVVGLHGRTSLWIAESYLFMFFPHHSETLNISFIWVSIYVTRL